MIQRDATKTARQRYRDSISNWNIGPLAAGLLALDFDADELICDMTAAMAARPRGYRERQRER